MFSPVRLSYLILLALQSRSRIDELALTFVPQDVLLADLIVRACIINGHPGDMLRQLFRDVIPVMVIGRFLLLDDLILKMRSPNHLHLGGRLWRLWF